MKIDVIPVERFEEKIDVIPVLLFPWFNKPLIRIVLVLF